VIGAPGHGQDHVCAEGVPDGGAQLAGLH
jgi:hypothetical protein